MDPYLELRYQNALAALRNIHRDLAITNAEMAQTRREYGLQTHHDQREYFLLKRAQAHHRKQLDPIQEEMRDSTHRYLQSKLP